LPAQLIISNMSTLISFYAALGASLCSLVFARLYKLQNPPSRNLTNQTAIVTGANSGLGLSIAVALAKQGATVCLACRNPDRGAAAVEHVLSHAGEASLGRVFCRIVDVGDLASVREFCKRWEKDGERKIDMLVHNAGIAAPPPSMLARGEDQLKIMYTTNFLGSFLMTHLLEDNLSPTARVVFTSSTGHYGGIFPSRTASTATAKELGKALKKTPVSSAPAYSLTKAQQVLFASLLQRRFDSSPDNQRSAHSYSPGFTSSAIFGKFEKNWLSNPLFTLLKLTETTLALDTDEGAKTGWWLASCGGEIEGGRYWDRMMRTTSLIDIMSEKVKIEEWRQWEKDAGVVWPVV
jgi:NAD(P)-dependent dehydrogenase (short-subunit alcohol dehydrogenase family)